MSYVVHFWKQPLPASVREAVTIHSTLSEQGGAQVGEFIELARKLTNRYPCITTLDDADGAWTDGPLDGMSDEPVYGIGINVHMLEDVLPFVRQCAVEVGLVMFDEQAGEVVLPDGSVLTLPGRVPMDMTPRPHSDPFRVPSDVNALLADSLAPLLESFGFKSQGSSNVNFSKGFDDHPFLQLQNVAFIVNGYEGNFAVRLCAYSSLDWRRVFGSDFDTQRFKAWHCEIDIQRALAALSTSHRADPSQSGQFGGKAITPTNAQAIAQEYGLVLQSVVLPTLKLCEEIASFDTLVNPSQPSSSVIAFSNVNLVVANLNGNPRYRDIVRREVRAAEERYDYAALTAIETLDAYLTQDLAMTVDKVIDEDEIRRCFVALPVEVDGPDRIYHFAFSADHNSAAGSRLTVVWTRRNVSGTFDTPVCISKRHGISNSVAVVTHDEMYKVHVALNFFHASIDITQILGRIVRRYDALPSAPE